MSDGSARDARPVISVTGVTKVYTMGENKVYALRGVDLEVYPGDMIAVMGSSGSGKSTLMNILGCLDVPSGGSYILDGVRVDGLDGNALADLRNQKLGFVFQNYNLIARTTALENVALPTLYTKMKREEGIKRAAAALALVDLDDRKDHYPSQMSGGQQQRVAIARALVNRPSILLADEPTGNLDTATGNEIMGLFERLYQQGNTIVLVTHEHDIALHAHRIIHVRDGKVEKDEKIK